MASVSSAPSVSQHSGSKNQSSSPRKKTQSVNYLPPCKGSNRDENRKNSKTQEGDSESKFDRRGILLGGLGVFVLYLLFADRAMLPSRNYPLTPDFAHCQPVSITPDKTINCCPPPFNGTIHDFIPPVFSRPRVRRPAHLITPDELARYEKAIALMKGLDKDDPRNFHQQANVHCAYCSNAYKQLGFSKADFAIHWNALFFPFHRAFLYFFERILGHLIDDPDFAIPFWNWDDIPGMQLPEIFNNETSPLYHTIRDARHAPPKLVDINYDNITEDPHFDVRECNLQWMNRQVLVNGKYAKGFHGAVIRGGDEADYLNGMGGMENSPHNTIHTWVGDPNCMLREDMGVYYSAARDPLFYSHHANLDRVWDIWQGLDNGKTRDFTDPAWLDSSFVFYDEHKTPVRIKVRDCLDRKKFGYVYEDKDVHIRWLYTKQIPRRRPPLASKLQASPVISYPQVLNSNITTAVRRPKKLRDKRRESEEDEILVIEDIEFDPSSRVHFNVLVNVFDDGSDVCSGNTEFAGSFSNMPHGYKHRAKTSLRLVITDQIEDLGLENDETVFVRIDPKVGGDKVTIGGIKIEHQRLN